MKCNVFVNSTINQLQRGTLLDDLDLRFTFTITYKSCQVDIDHFIDSVGKAYVNHYNAKRPSVKDQDVVISRFLWMKIVNRLENTNKKYLVCKFDKDDQFKTVGDLIQFSQITYTSTGNASAIASSNINLINQGKTIHCNIYLEALPTMVFFVTDELLELFLKQIPVEMIFDARIEWNDFDSLLLEYCDLCKNFAVDHDSKRCVMGWKCKTLFDDILFNSLQVTGVHSFEREVENRGSNRGTIILANSLLSHFLYLHNI